VRIQVALPTEQRRRLAAYAGLTGRTEASVISEALESVLAGFVAYSGPKTLRPAASDSADSAAVPVRLAADQAA
jgi:hypothetical protein